MLTAVSIVLLAAGMAAIIRGNRDEFLSIDTTVTARGALALVIILHHLAVQANETNSMFYNEGGGGTTLFLFLSGYGVWFSIQKTKSVKGFLIKRIRNLLLPFGIVFICFEAIECFIVKSQGLTTVAKDLFELRLPHYTNWFVKAILAMYILSVLAYLISRKVLHSYEMVVLLGCIAWIVICRAILHLSSFWYNSILGFALGSVVARYKNEIEKLFHMYFWQILILLCIGSTVLIWRIGSLSGVVGNLFFCLDALLILGTYGAKSKVLYWLGTMSYELYLWHLLFKYYLFMSWIPMDVAVLVVIVASVAASFVTHRVLHRGRSK